MFTYAYDGMRRIIVVFGKRRGIAAEVWRSVRMKSDISTVIAISYSNLFGRMSFSLRRSQVAIKI